MFRWRHDPAQDAHFVIQPSIVWNIFLKMLIGYIKSEFLEVFYTDGVGSYIIIWWLNYLIESGYISQKSNITIWERAKYL